MRRIISDRAHSVNAWRAEVSGAQEIISRAKESGHAASVGPVLIEEDLDDSRRPAQPDPAGHASRPTAAP
jgi:hypothetical protein